MDCQLVVTPSSRLAVRETSSNSSGVSADDAGLAKEIRLFTDSIPEGLFHLACTRFESSLPPDFAYWQVFSQTYLTELCHTPETASTKIDAIDPPSHEELEEVLQSAPPISGGEYLTTGTLKTVWRELDEWVRDQVGLHPKGLAGFLKDRAPLWHQVGRVAFHLAENRRDPLYPFAFLATYIPGISDGSRVQYQPLSKAVLVILRAMLISKARLAIENLALRQQLAICRQSIKRPKLRPRDRVFWACLSRIWPDWRPVLAIVQPETVIKRHRLGFKLYWRWKSRGEKFGPPCIPHEIRVLIRRMSRENPIWGAPRIQAELRLLGYDVAESTVAKYMIRTNKPSSPTWKTFLREHAHEIVACDFFTVPTATFRVLYCFVVLSHDRRRVLHFNVTEHPTAPWTAQQIVEACPWDDTPKYLLRDNDSIYGIAFQDRIASLGIEEVKTAYRSPWQNPFVERLISSIRRECLDHVIVLSERHLKRILREYFDYYNNSRAHMSLNGNAPLPREVESPDHRNVIAIPQAGGLHHRYTRIAA